MSFTWRPDDIGKHLCGHPRCTWLERISAACMIGAFLALAWLLTAPCIAAIAASGGLLAAGFGAAHWPHPRAGDPGIEALVNATREQRFTGLGRHFDEWERELQR